MTVVAILFTWWMAVSDVTASQGSPTFAMLVADIADEAAVWLREDARGPLGVALPTLAGDLNVNAATDLRMRLGDAARRAGNGEVYCDPCDAVIAQRAGARAILQAHFEEHAGELSVTLRVVDLAGKIERVRRIDGDARRAGLMRDHDKVVTVEQREAQLEEKRQSKGGFGNAFVVGALIIPVSITAPVQGVPLSFKANINGLMFAYRFYEQFGAEKSFMFGVQAQGFIDPSFQNNLPDNTFDDGVSLPAAGGMFSAVFGYTFTWADLRIPRIRIGGQGGVFLGGSLGNSFAAGGLVEVLLRFRLGLNAGILYIGETTTTIEPVTFKIGGLSYMAGGSFNWD